MIKFPNIGFTKAVESIAYLTTHSQSILADMREKINLSEDKTEMRNQVYDTALNNVPDLVKGIIEVFLQDETVCEKVFREALLDSYVLSDNEAEGMILMGYNSASHRSGEKKMLINLYGGSRVGLALDIVGSVIQEKLNTIDVDLTGINFNEVDPTVVSELMDTKYKGLTSFHK